MRCFYSIKISKSRSRIQLLPLRRQAFYSTSPPPKGWGQLNSIRSRPYVKGAAGGPHGPPLTTPAEGAGGKPTDTTAAAVWRVCAASCARLYDIGPRRKQVCSRCPVRVLRPVIGQRHGICAAAFRAFYCHVHHVRGGFAAVCGYL